MKQTRPNAVRAGLTGVDEVLETWRDDMRERFVNALSAWDIGHWVEELGTTGVLRSFLEGEHGVEQPMDDNALTSARAALRERLRGDSRPLSDDERRYLPLVVTDEELEWIELFDAAGEPGGTLALRKAFERYPEFEPGTTALAASAVAPGDGSGVLARFLSVPNDECPSTVVGGLLTEVDEEIFRVSVVEEQGGGAHWLSLRARVRHPRKGHEEVPDEVPELRDVIDLAEAIGPFARVKPLELLNGTACPSQVASGESQLAFRDPRLLRRALIQHAAELLRSGSWERCAELAKNLSLMDLPIEERSVVEVIAGWASLQLAQNTVAGHDRLVEDDQPSLDALADLIHLCKEVRSEGVMFDHSWLTEAGQSAITGVTDALAALSQDQRSNGAESLVMLGDTADRLLKGNAFQRSVGIWLRVLQTILLFRRGRYDYAQRVGRFTSRLLRQRLPELVAFRQMIDDVVENSVRAAGENA